MNYTVSEAKNKLHRLVKEAEAGTRVTITRRGVSVVEILRRIEEPSRKRVFGVLGNKKIVLDPDWAHPHENVNTWLTGDI